MYSLDVLAQYIHGSNTLDAITLTLEQTKGILANEATFGDSAEIAAPDGKEFETGIVTGHRHALETVLRMAKDQQPLSELGIRHLHEQMMGPILLSAGEYRECTLRIKGLLIASPPDGLTQRMDAFANLINAGIIKSKNKDQFAWRVHHEFFTLHPFIEGNGRLARLLLNYVRHRAGLGLAILGRQDRERYSKAIIEFQKQKIKKARSRTQVFRVTELEE